MKLKELKRQVDGSDGTGNSLIPILNEWSNEGRYKNSNEQYLMGSIYLLEKWDIMNEPMPSQVELYRVLVESDVMTLLEFKELFHTFPQKAVVSFLLAYCYNTDRENDNLFDLFMTYSNYSTEGVPHHGICNLIYETTSVPFVLKQIDVLKKIVDDDHVDFLVMSTMDEVTLKDLFTDVLKRTNTNGSREIMTKSLTFNPIEVKRVVGGNSMIYYNYLKRIVDLKEELDVNDIPEEITDSRYLEVVPNTDFFTRLGISDAEKKAFRSARESEIKTQMNELVNKIKSATAGAMALPQEIKVKILSYTIDTLDDMWLYKLKVFPLDGDKEAKDNMDKVIALSGRERPVLSDERPAKVSRTSVNMSNDERALARKFVKEIEKAIKETFN